eukprot:scaffold49731_cov48-Phaeocystis_antarctica.AAC.3
MAAPVGAVWLADEHRYRTAEEQTEGTMPANVWLVGFSQTVLPASALPALRDDGLAHRRCQPLSGRRSSGRAPSSRATCRMTRAH